jgi:transmembrane sensor
MRNYRSILLVGVFVVVIAYGTYVEWGSPPPSAAVVDQTPAKICGKQLVVLEDHSAVNLNADACIAAEVTSKARVVTLLSGEALFQVAHDPNRPFFVRVGPLSIADLATQFDVFRTKTAHTRVAVIDGAVRITGPSRPDIKPLTVQEQLDIPDDIAQSRVRKHITSSDISRVTAWVHGDIIFGEKTTVKEALDEFARYKHFAVVRLDPSIAEIRVGGTYHTDAIDRFLNVLKSMCIQSDYDKVKQRIALTTEAGKRAGGLCL